MNIFISSILFSFILWSPVDMSEEAEEDRYKNCLDNKGQEVSHGYRFFPLGKDACTQCTCLHGKPEMCAAVSCSPPEHCKQYREISDKCCEYICLDGVYSNKVFKNSTHTDKDDTRYGLNLGFRLVTSPNTSFSILALLMFMHKWSL